MKIRSFAFAILSVVLLFSGCGEKKSESTAQTLDVSNASLSFAVDGGNNYVTVRSSSLWKTSTDAGWLSVAPAGGNGGSESVQVYITVSENLGPERYATVTFSSGSLTKTLAVVQEGVKDDGVPRLTIAEFRSKKDSSTEWYRVSGEVVSIANSEYGDFYMMDDTGYLYVYGLAPERSGDNKAFTTLGIKPGDNITIIAHHKTYNNVIETDGAYLESKKTGTYPGYSAAKAKAGWMELPQTSGDDAFDYLCHLNNNGRRNYSVYYDKAGRVAHWVAYPYCHDDKNDTGRSDAYAFDPLIGEADQPYLNKSYQLSQIDGDSFVRGHMVPSYDRGGRRNLDVFLATNIMPQSSELNSGSWGKLEEKVRSMSNYCDTLYIVIGTDISDSSLKVKDNVNRDVTVPDGVYKAVLAYSKDFGYKGLAAYFVNRKSDAEADIKSKTMSIDELEEKVGVDFFVNLPDDIEKDVEAKKPAEDSWWRF